MKPNSNSARSRARPYAPVWTLALTGFIVAMGGGFYLAWSQAEEERIAPWKQGWDYVGADQALKMYPNQPNSHIAMASVWMKQRQYDKAIQEYQKSVILEPNNAYTHLDLGNAFARSGQLVKAKLQWQSAVRLDVPGGSAAKEASGNLVKNVTLSK